MTAAAQRDVEHLVRALSHDMCANFMLLESSIGQLKRLFQQRRHEGMSYAGREHQSLPGQFAHVEACLRQSRALLDDLVQLARTGAVDMEPARTDLEPIVAEVVFEQRDLLARRGIRVAVERPLPACWCNPLRLKQVVTNLVRNAALHGCRRESPRIDIGRADTARLGISDDTARLGLPDDGKTWAVFCVRDNGPGIDPRHREEIFLPGRRLGDRDGEGTGLGLAIVRKIVGYYGGLAYVDPEYREGTSMVVILPAPLESPLGVASGPGDSAAMDEGRRWKLQRQGHLIPEHEHARPEAPAHRGRPSSKHLARLDPGPPGV
jgi:signal transduction histidine kinase